MKKNSFGILENIDEECGERAVEQYNGRNEGLEKGEIELVNELLTKALGSSNASVGEDNNANCQGDTANSNNCESFETSEMLVEGENATGNAGLTKGTNVICDEGSPLCLNENGASTDSGQTNLAVVKCMDGDKDGKSGGKAFQQSKDITIEIQYLNASTSLNENGEKVSTFAAAEQQMGRNLVSSEETDSTNKTLIQSISEDMQHIEDKLQSELEEYESNTKQFHVTSKTMRDFMDFRERNKLDQLNKPRLEGIADLVKQMVVSVINRGQTTPTSKCTNPYAHIAAPSAFKERPPEPITVPVAVNSSEKTKSNPHITRSRKKEMLRNLQENG